MSTYRINKIFIEIRYNDSILFNNLEKVEQVNQELISLFTESTYDSENKVLAMGSSSKKAITNISINRTTIDMELPERLEDFKSVAMPVIDAIIKVLNIKSFKRIGMRTFKGIEKKNFNEVDRYIKNNFIKYDDAAYRILNENIYNFSTKFSFKVDEYNCIMGVSPEVYKKVDINNFEENADSENMSFQAELDIDIFMQGMLDSFEIRSSFIDKVINIHNERLDKFINKISKS